MYSQTMINNSMTNTEKIISLDADFHVENLRYLLNEAIVNTYLPWV